MTVCNSVCSSCSKPGGGALRADACSSTFDQGAQFPPTLALTRVVVTACRDRAIGQLHYVGAVTVRVAEGTVGQLPAPATIPRAALGLKSMGL